MAISGFWGLSLTLLKLLRPSEYEGNLTLEFIESSDSHSDIPIWNLLDSNFLLWNKESGIFLSS